MNNPTENNIMDALVGPGSQPEDDDGGRLEYMKMPAGMMTYSAPDLPEAEETSGLEKGKAVLEATLDLLKDFSGDDPASYVDVTGVNAANLKLIDQVLGEGEVSVIAGANIQAQESVLAGVWRIRCFDDNGLIVGDAIEVASFPQMVMRQAFSDAKPAVEIPDCFGPNIFNAPPLLPEINAHIPGSMNGAPAHVINLSLLPHTPEDLEFLDHILGDGGISILSRGYGNCRINAAGTRNVWWVRFFNSQETLILNTVEITTIPEVACAAREDISDSAERLDEILEMYR
ncbi:hydrogenase expression/formation C-terminal domain-containing protein [Hoeflea sp. TYP-13]|uniref:hydrogenase expression/formation protein n=1 Tax=Hoeflea sp. TYP-13 TaxID=3230023 RepID=UPI0034C632B8